MSEAISIPATISPVWMVVGAVLLLGILIVLAVILKFAKLWIRAISSRANVTMRELIGMWLRKVDAGHRRR